MFLINLFPRLFQEEILNYFKTRREQHNMEFFFTCGLAISIIGLIYIWRKKRQIIGDHTLVNGQC